MSGTVKIPVSADTGGIAQALRQVQAAIDGVAKDAKSLADIDLSHPELRDLADDLRRVKQNLDDLQRTARGETAAAIRAVYDGSGVGLFGPGGIITEGLARRYPDLATRSRILSSAGGYILSGTRWAPGPPAPSLPPGPTEVVPASTQEPDRYTARKLLSHMFSSLAGAGGFGGSGVRSGARFGAELGGTVGTAIGPEGTVAGSLIGGALGGLAGWAAGQTLATLGDAARRAYGLTREDWQSTDTLSRHLRDTTESFDQLNATIHEAGRGLQMTVQETDRLALQWTKLTNQVAGSDVAQAVRISAANGARLRRGT
jgi:hypothetical protein